MLSHHGRIPFKRATVTRLIALWIATTGFSVPAAAKEVPGWFVGRMDEKSCIAIGAKTDEASFGLTSEGPQVWLFVASESFKGAQGESRMGITVDDSAEFQVGVIGKDLAYRTIVNRQLYESIKAASHIAFAVAARRISFQVQNVSQAVDALSHCTGTPTLEEMWAPPWEAIPQAGEWRLDRHLPTTSGCAARVSGGEVDTIIGLNKDRKLLLVAARPDWVMASGQHQVQLQIDDATPMPILVANTNNLVFTSIPEDVTVARLRVAMTITWIFPNGRLHAQIAGLGAAFDAVLRCQP